VTKQTIFLMQVLNGAFRIITGSEDDDLRQQQQQQQHQQRQLPQEDQNHANEAMSFEDVLNNVSEEASKLDNEVRKSVTPRSVLSPAASEPPQPQQQQQSQQHSRPMSATGRPMSATGARPKSRSGGSRAPSRLKSRPASRVGGEDEEEDWGDEDEWEYYYEDEEEEEEQDGPRAGSEEVVQQPEEVKPEPEPQPVESTKIAQESSVSAAQAVDLPVNAVQDVLPAENPTKPSSRPSSRQRPRPPTSRPGSRSGSRAGSRPTSRASRLGMRTPLRGIGEDEEDWGDDDEWEYYYEDEYEEELRLSPTATTAPTTRATSPFPAGQANASTEVQITPHQPTLTPQQSQQVHKEALKAPQETPMTSQQPGMAPSQAPVVSEQAPVFHQEVPPAHQEHQETVTAPQDIPEQAKAVLQQTPVTTESSAEGKTQHEINLLEVSHPKVASPKPAPNLEETRATSAKSAVPNDASTLAVPRQDALCSIPDASLALATEYLSQSRAEDRKKRKHRKKSKKEGSATPDDDEDSKRKKHKKKKKKKKRDDEEDDDQEKKRGFLPRLGVKALVSKLEPKLFQDVVAGTRMVLSGHGAGDSSSSSPGQKRKSVKEIAQMIAHRGQEVKAEQPIPAPPPMPMQMPMPTGSAQLSPRIVRRSTLPLDPMDVKGGGRVLESDPSAASTVQVVSGGEVHTVHMRQKRRATVEARQAIRSPDEGSEAYGTGSSASDEREGKSAASAGPSAASVANADGDEEGKPGSRHSRLFKLLQDSDYSDSGESRSSSAAQTASTAERISLKACSDNNGSLSRRRGSSVGPQMAALSNPGSAHNSPLLPRRSPKVAHRQFSGLHHNVESYGGEESSSLQRGAIPKFQQNTRVWSYLQEEFSSSGAVGPEDSSYHSQSQASMLSADSVVMVSPDEGRVAGRAARQSAYSPRMEAEMRELTHLPPSLHPAANRSQFQRSFDFP